MHRGGRTGKIGRLGQAIHRTLRGMWRGHSVESSRSYLVAVAEELEARRLLAISPLGAEFQVNTFTTSWQFHQSVAMDATGNYVVVWSSDLQDGSSYGIFGRRYNAAGVAQGTEFQVNSFTPLGQGSPSVAMDADGDFVVAWGTPILDGSDSAIVARRFNSTGTPLGTEFVVNSHATGIQSSAAIAMRGSGEFVVAWEAYGRDGSDASVHARLFSSTGSPLGNEFQLNTYASGAQTQPQVAINDAGALLFVWESPQDGSQRGAYARRFDPAGNPLGVEFRVNTFTTGDQRLPSVAMDESGDSVVVWRSYGQDGHLAGIYGQKLSEAGLPQGPEFRVNNFTTGYQWWSSVAMRPAGDFVVAWASEHQLGSGRDGIYFRRYDAEGGSIAGEYQVNTVTTHRRSHTAVAMSPEGDIVVTWVASNQDGSLDGVYGRFFDAVAPSAGATIGNRTWNDLNVNGIQDPGEPGIGGVVISVLALGPLGLFPADTGRSDSSGGYSFVVPTNQVVFLSFRDPGGLRSTRFNQGGDDHVDSDSDAGFTGYLSYTSPATVDDSIDAGFAQYGTVNGLVFNDRNGNGAAHLGSEEVLESVRVFLDEDSDGVLDSGERSTLSSVLGTFTFDWVITGLNTLTVVKQSVWTQPVVAIDVTGSATPLLVELPMQTDTADSMLAPVGSQFLVNSYTTGNQVSGNAAVDAVGNYVVTWSSPGQDGSGDGVYARRYNASGVAIGSEFRVNAYTTGNQRLPVVAVSAVGEFTIAWNSEGQDGSGSGVYARRYNADGVALDSEFRVNTATVGAQLNPAIAMAPDGDWVLAWIASDGGSYGVFAQRFQASGSAVDSEFRVNTYTTSVQQRPAIAMESDGDFIVAWDSLGQDGSSYGVYARRFDSIGMAEGTEFLVNRTTASNQTSPALGVGDTGDFAIAWHSDHGTTRDIYAIRFSADGVAQGEEFRVNNYTTGTQEFPAVTYVSDAGMMIAWRGASQTDTSGVNARRFSAAGLPQSTEWRVNATTANQQIVSSIATYNGDCVVVVWTDLAGGTTGWNVFSQRYAFAPVPTVMSGQFTWTSLPQRIALSFETDIEAFISAPVLNLQNLSSPSLSFGGVVVSSYEDQSNTAIFTFPTLPNGGALPNGRYRATFVPPNAPAAATQSFEFFFMNGDANHDGRVDIHDLMSLAVNFGSSGDVDYSKADFNYDGVVNHADLGILGLNWQKSLDSLAPALPAAATAAPQRAPSRTPTRTSSAVIELVEEPAPTSLHLRSATRVAGKYLDVR